MWFKNIRVYKLTRPIDLSVETLETALEKRKFIPCANIDYSRIGWEPPLGPLSEQYVHPVGNYLMLCARKQEKILPAAAINEVFEEKVQEFESSRERKMFRKERTSLKDDIVHTLLPRALTRSNRMYGYFDVEKGLLVIDAASATKAEEFLDWLRGTLGELPVVPLACHGEAADIMTRWLQHAPSGFVLDDDCELQNQRDAKNIVKCRKQDLESDEVLGHVKAGKRVTQLAVVWRDSIRFILGDDFAIKRVKFEDKILQQADSDAEDAAAQFDQDFAVMTLQISHFVDELLKEFGGMSKEAELPARAAEVA